MRSFGPADTQKRLTWVSSKGESQVYPISEIGGGYPELEVRIRADSQAIWLVARDRQEVVATLDLISGQFTGGGGTLYDSRAEQSTKGPIRVSWASLNGGKLL